MTKKEKIIIAILGIILLCVSIGAFWDLYGKKHICIGNCAKSESASPNADPTPPNVATSPANGKNRQAKVQVDETLFASCTEGVTDNKECKDCCDGLDQDEAVIMACKKVCNTIGQ